MARKVTLEVLKRFADGQDFDIRDLDETCIGKEYETIWDLIPLVGCEIDEHGEINLRF